MRASSKHIAPRQRRSLRGFQTAESSDCRTERAANLRRGNLQSEALPDGNSALIPVAAQLRHVAGTKWGQKRYLDMSRLKELDHFAPEPLVARPPTSRSWKLRSASGPPSASSAINQLQLKTFLRSTSATKCAKLDGRYRLPALPAPPTNHNLTPTQNRPQIHQRQNKCAKLDGHYRPDSVFMENVADAHRVQRASPSAQPT